MAKNHIITGLDLGTKSIKVLVAGKKPDSQELEVLSQVEIPSFGIRKGVIVNIDEVAKNIKEAISQVQQEIGRKIEDVYVNVSGGHLYCTPSHGTVIVSRADQKISEEDVNRVVQSAQAFSLPSNKEILDIYPREFIVDGQGQIKEPLDMQGVRLEVEVLALCGFSPYLKNLTSAVLDAGFQISDITPSPLASARAVLTPQQKELGVSVVDIGAGTCDLAVYEEGDLIHTAVFPIGSDHITNDIAVGLKTDIDIAEKIKQEFGACLWKGGKKKEKIELPKDSGNGEPLVFSQKTLVGIIEARTSEIFDLIQKELKNISPRGLLPAGVVLTGGGAKLPKIVELAKKELKLPCRLGFPVGLLGMERDSAWSTVGGLVLGGDDLLNEGGVIRASSLGKETFSRIKKIFRIFIP
jgi:cell division protein FtsA